jgi:hypothetical protein
MGMFLANDFTRHVGSKLNKSPNLDHLREVEQYFVEKVNCYNMHIDYHVSGEEYPYFTTFTYTEWARCFVIAPLNTELKNQQMTEAFYTAASSNYNYNDYFKNSVITNVANKYVNPYTLDSNITSKSALVILPGSNRLKSHTCFIKLKEIKLKHGTDVWFKPHPFTSYEDIAELKEQFGDECVLDRDLDLYTVLLDATTVYTTYMSESVVYAAVLDKEIEPIDLYSKIPTSAFCHVNQQLFNNKSPTSWLNTVMNNYKSGIINPVVDKNWKQKIDNYLTYIMDIRESYKDKFIDPVQYNISHRK